MFQILLYGCIVQAATSIIVTDPPPTSTEYNYWYDIVDPSTGDAKRVHEYRQGDSVKGSYSVIHPDGIKRIVDYVAGKHGFKATVHKEPIDPNQFQQHNYKPSSPRNIDGNGYVYPVPYLKKIQMSKFSANSFIRSEPNYFTPDNDTSSDSLTFKDGEYFMPNYMHN